MLLCRLTSGTLLAKVSRGEILAVSKWKITLNAPELKMSITQLLPALKTLSRAEKLRVMQFLVQELATEEEASLLETGATYHIWSPLNSHKAAQTLATMLEDEQKENHD